MSPRGSSEQVDLIAVQPEWQCLRSIWKRDSEAREVVSTSVLVEAACIPVIT